LERINKFAPDVAKNYAKLEAENATLRERWAKLQRWLAAIYRPNSKMTVGIVTVEDKMRQLSAPLKDSK